MVKSITTNKFLQKAITKYGDKFDYSKVDYKHSTKEVIIICKTHGEFLQMPKNHLYGSGCRKCAREYKTQLQTKTKTQFIEAANKLHTNQYDYSLVGYLGIRSIVNIICHKHGVFTQSPEAHLKGQRCRKCGTKNNKKRLELASAKFIFKSKQIHNDFYCYSLVNYIRPEDLVTIICPLHGEFSQIPHSHLKGSGCRRCSVEKSGWHYSNWEESGLKSKNFDSFKVYIIRCWNGNEEFIKIGKTFNTIKSRFPVKERMPYNYEILHIESHKTNAREISELEHELQRNLKKYSYIPSISFNGNLECFTIGVVKFIEERFPVFYGIRLDK